MPTDLNQRAKAIVDLATGEREVAEPDERKNPAAVELGRLGGKKGGKARAEKLTLGYRCDRVERVARGRVPRVRREGPDPARTVNDRTGPLGPLLDPLGRSGSASVRRGDLLAA